MAAHFLLSKEARNFTLADVERLSEDEVHALFARQRWGAYGEKKQVCPACGSIDSHYVVHRRHQWRCKASGCSRTFSVTTGTKFQDHKLPLKKILLALALYVNALKGISASQLARTIGVAYQTAFVLLHKLREGLLDVRNLRPLERHAEIDGGHFSGRIRKPRKKVKATAMPARAKQGKSWYATHPNRRIVMVLREVSPVRGQGATRTIVEIVPAEAETYVTPLARRYIKKGSIVHTDESNAFSRLAVHYEHFTVNHSVEFSTDDGVNENQAESFFARCRRLVWGQIHRMAPKYMLDYVNEIAWREDSRRIGPKAQVGLLLDASLHSGRSRWWRGYWQGNHRPGEMMFDQNLPAGSGI
jgi:transposase-like protein